MGERGDGGGFFPFSVGKFAVANFHCKVLGDDFSYDRNSKQ